MLTGGSSRTWKYSTAKDCNGNTYVFDNDAMSIRHTFKSNGDYVMTDGGTVTGTWRFYDSDSKIIRSFTSANDTLIINSLSDTELVVDGCTHNVELFWKDTRLVIAN